MIHTIERITYARSTLPESWILPGGDGERRYPILFSVFVIRTEERTVLVDAGCDTMPGFEMEDFIGPVEALRRAGYRAEDITDVILTHAHHDHIEAVYHFAGARVWLHRAEHAYALRHDSLRGVERLELIDGDTELETGLRIVHTGGHTAGSCVVEASFGGERYVLCGDECYSLRNVREGIPTASTQSSERSQAFIDRYAKGEYTCLLAHDE